MGALDSLRRRRRPPATTRASSRATVSTLAVVAMLVTTTCAGGESDPTVVDVGPIESAPSSADAVDNEPRQVWGHGRAVDAVATPTGGLLTVTTTGVQLVTEADREPVAVDRFRTPIEVGPVSVDADATSLAVVALPATIRTYDLATPAPTGTFDLPPGVSIRSLAFDPAGRLVADTTLGPFVTSDTAVSPLPLVDRPSGRTATLADGTLLTPVTGTDQLVVSRPEDADGAARPVSFADEATVLDAHASPSGGVVAVSAGIGENKFERQDRIVVLDPVDFEVLATIETGRVLEPVQWTVTDRAVVVADGPSLMVWAHDGTMVGSADATDSAITGLHPSAAGLLTTHVGGGIVRWTPEASAPVVVDPGGVARSRVQLDQAGTRATTVDHFGRVETWDLDRAARIADDDRFAPGELTAVAVSADGAQIGAASSTGRAVVLDSDLGDVATLEVATSPALVGAVAFDPAGGAVAAGLAERIGDTAFDDGVSLWEPGQRTPRFTVGGEGENVTGCAFYFSRIRFGRDGALMAVTSHDFSVEVIDVATGDLAARLPGTTTVLDIAFSPDGELLVATYEDATVNVWRTSDFELAANHRGPQGGYFAIAVLPDDTTMAVADILGSIQLIDLLTGDHRLTFADTALRTSTLALSDDGTLLAAPVADARIGVWSTGSGARLTTLEGHTADVTGVAFSPDGAWLASSSSDGTVRTWTLDVAG